MKGVKINLNEDFEKAFKRWNRRVYAYAYSKTGSEYLAEETVQRVFLKLWQYLNKNERKGEMEALIFVIARTTIIDLLRQDGGYRDLQQKLPVELYHSDSPYNLYRYKEIQSQLNYLIGQMPTMRKKVFVMSRFENLSHKEISNRLSISTKTVENHITLALRFLRKFLLFFYMYFYSS